LKYGICNLSIVPIRKEPSDQAEMVSQLLFGETFKIIPIAIRSEKKWLKIQTTFDQYEGWIDEKQFLPVNEKYFTDISQMKVAITMDLVHPATTDNSYIPIVIGSSLSNFDGVNFQLLKQKFHYNGQAIIPDNSNINLLLISKIANKYLNAPYLWGGRSPFGIDCSGFTQMVFKLIGISLKRDAYQQAEQGRIINFVEESQEGDLAFFENEERKIIHVGIILNNTENPSARNIIHASGKVRIDKLDHHGIYNISTKKYSHRLRIIKRICANI